MVERKTYFIDIDGTLLHHHQDFTQSLETDELLALPGAKKKTIQWHCEGSMLILTTARPESTRALTERQLQLAGIIYDTLIMGIGSGERILINDYSDPHKLKARAFNVNRNIDGLTGLS